jgi:hypothetical protein
VLGYDTDRQRELLVRLGSEGRRLARARRRACCAVLGVFVLGLFAWMLRGPGAARSGARAWNPFCGKLARGAWRARRTKARATIPSAPRAACPRLANQSGASRVSTSLCATAASAAIAQVREFRRRVRNWSLDETRFPAAPGIPFCANPWPRLLLAEPYGKRDDVADFIRQMAERHGFVDRN